MLTLALIGDLHLHEKSPRYAHVLEVLDWTIDDALTQGATGIVFMGDLVEGRPSPQEVYQLASRFHRIRAANAWVAVVQGNHEDAETGLLWKALGVRRSAWNAFEVIHDEATILLVPYPRRGRPPFDGLKDDGTIKGSMVAAAERIALEIMAEKAVAQTSPELAAPLIVLGHFTMAGMRTRDAEFEIHSATEVTVPIDALRGAAFVGVGHIHKEQWHCGSCAAWVDGWLPACACGALATGATLRGVGDLIRCSFGEAEDEKSYTLLTVDGGRVSWHRRAVPAREMRHWEMVWDRADIESFLGAIDPADLPSLEIKCTVHIPEDRLATFDPTIFDGVKAAAALWSLDKQTILIERVRAPAIATADTPAAQLTAWLDSIAYEGGEADRATLAGMLAEVMS